MKKIILLMAGGLMIASCSTPKYAYHFDHYDYNSGKKHAVAQTTTNTAEAAEVSPLIIPEQSMVASVATSPVPVSAKNITPADQKAIAEKIASLSKAERKDLKKELKEEMKKMVKAKKSGDNFETVKATKQWDHDLKMAAIFGAVGLVLSLFYGVSPVFWVLGVIALVVAIVFLIKWISRQ